MEFFLKLIAYTPQGYVRNTWNILDSFVNLECAFFVIQSCYWKYHSKQIFPSFFRIFRGLYIKYSYITYLVYYWYSLL